MRAIGADFGCLVAVTIVNYAFVVLPHKVEAVGVLAVGHQVEAVGDDLRAAFVAPSDDGALGYAAARHRAAEDAAVNLDAAVSAMAQDAADLRAAADVGRGHAVVDPVARAFREAHDGCRVQAAVDGAGHGEVLDGGAVDVAEQRSALVVGVGNGGGDSVPVAEEGAAEGFLRRAARHGAAFLRDVDVVRQFHILAAVSSAFLNVIDEGVPLVGIIDEVGGALRAAAGEGGGRYVVLTVVEDAIIVSPHHAVVLDEGAKGARH